MHFFIPLWMVYTLLTGGAYYAGKEGIGANAAQSFMTSMQNAVTTQAPAAAPAQK